MKHESVCTPCSLRGRGKKKSQNEDLEEKECSSLAESIGRIMVKVPRLMISV